MTERVEVTEADYAFAAELAAMAERIVFGGNDVAALRNQFTASDSILEFVRGISRYRQAAYRAGMERAKEIADSQIPLPGSILQVDGTYAQGAIAVAEAIQKEIDREQ